MEKKKILPTRHGVNAQCQYDWSTTNVQELLVQYYYQLVRPEKNNTYKYDYLEAQYFLLVSSIILNNEPSTTPMSKGFQRECLMLAYKMIAQTRDIVMGKGEYRLSYIMISVLSYMNITYDGLSTLNMAKHALRSFVLPPNNHSNTQPYGSWKDIKNFCNYCKIIGFHETHPIIQYAIHLMTSQLHKDVIHHTTKSTRTPTTSTSTSTSTISLVAKWIPREKSKKFGWMYPYLVQSYYNLKHLPNPRGKYGKHLKKFRILLSKYNHLLQTTQIAQTKKEYASIQLGKNVTSQTFVKQYKAFMKHGVIANYFKSNFPTTISTLYPLSEHISMYDFVRIASKEDDPSLLRLIDDLWKKNAVIKNPYNASKQYLLPIVDTSIYMQDYSNDSLYNAIGLAIRTSELSQLKNRILLFSQVPRWIKLDASSTTSGPLTFSQKVKTIMHVLKTDATMNLNSNIFLAIHKILQGFIDSKMPPEWINSMTWILFSDMQQVDDNTLPYSSTTATSPSALRRFLIFESVYDKIKSLFYKAGILSDYRKPFEPCHIVFWNLKSSLGFPCQSTTPNVTMVSGYTPTILNQFIKPNTISLSSSTTTHTKTHTNTHTTTTPWETVRTIMNHPRYNPMEQLLIDSWDAYDIITSESIKY